MKRLNTKAPARRRAALTAGLLAGLTSCASVEFTRDTETSGSFTSVARTFTFLSYDVPRSARIAAHENVADSGLPNATVTDEKFTDWGWWDWVLDIISVRSARVEGTWGDRGE